MNITVVGTGYVGLVTGTCFAETGINVTCIDTNVEKIENLKKGIIPIYEPGLEDMVLQNSAKGRLSFSTKLTDHLDVDAVFIAVGTPPGEDGSADLSYVLSVAAEIGKNLNRYTVVVTKSTVPIGTSKKIKNAIAAEIEKRGVNINFDIASNPEFLKEGTAIDDFLKPDRIIAGVETEEAEKIVQKLYKPFLLNGHPLLIMDIPSAEMTKYAANAMLATKISFINDIANLCEIVGADVNMVRKGIGSDSRIGNRFIYPGVGYGGSCFPKDVKALIKTSDENLYSLEILKAVEKVNNAQKEVLFKKLFQHFKGNLSGLTIAVWGLSFKPKTDDMREAPSLTIIENILQNGAKVKAYDPVAMKESEKFFNGGIEYGKDPYDVLIDADALLLVTEWPEFRIPNFKIIEKLLKNKLIFDGRNIFDPYEMRELGFTYYCIGRKTVN